MQKLAALALLALLAACGGSAPPSSGGTGGTGAGSGAIGGGGTGGISGTGAVGGGGSAGGDCFNAGTDPNRNMVSASGVCERLAQIQCAAEACCCPTGNPRKYASLDACIASQTNICDQIGTETVAADSRSGFNAAALKTAFDEFERLASMCSLDVVTWGTSPQGFGSVLAGSVGAGGTCWSPIADGQDPAAIASCGTTTGLACLGSSVQLDQNWTCDPRAGAGERCLVDPSCADGFFCTPLPMTATAPLGTCTLRLRDGDPCERPTQCTSLFCVDGRCVPPSVEAAYCIQP